jgi:hypothetical protein
LPASKNQLVRVGALKMIHTLSRERAPAPPAQVPARGGCPGDLSRLARQGFTVEDHDLTLYGRCNQCAPAAKRARLAPRVPQGSTPRHRG